MILHEFNRFLNYYRNCEEIKTLIGIRERNTRDGRKRDSHKAASGFIRLFINLGKVGNFLPSELVSLLDSSTHEWIELGCVDLMKSFSFFKVEGRGVRNVMKALNRASWNSRKISVEVASGETGKSRRGSGSTECRGGRHPSGSSSEKHGNSNYNLHPGRSDRAP